MAKTFKFFIEYFQENFSNNHYIIFLVISSAIIQVNIRLATIKLVAMASVAIAIFNNLSIKLKKMKNILLILIRSIKAICNFNY